MPRSGVTIRDVAARAGVSHQTVSRVINNSERVNPATRAKVQAAIAELGFHPNAIARFMAQGRTRTLACLSPNLSDYTFAAIIEGAQKAAREYGYVLVTSAAQDEEIFTELIDELVTSGRTEGLMVINPYADGRHARLPQDFPIVFVGARPRQIEVDSVALDDVAAGRMATQFLIDLGHRKIALFTGPLVEDCSQDRRTGYLTAMADAGLPADPSLVLHGDWSATSGFDGVQQLLQKGVAFTAIFAQNDRIAAGATKALREARLHTPNDVSVVGFDDMPLASYFDPPLTTVRQDLFQIGAQAAQLLIRAVENPDAPKEHRLLPAELVVRNSTGPPDGKRR